MMPIGIIDLFFMCTLWVNLLQMGVIQLEKRCVHVKLKEQKECITWEIEEQIGCINKPKTWLEKHNNLKYLQIYLL